MRAAEVVSDSIEQIALLSFINMNEAPITKLVENSDSLATGMGRA
jgi:hypothetical protein